MSLELVHDLEPVLDRPQKDQRLAQEPSEGLRQVPALRQAEADLQQSLELHRLVGGGERHRGGTEPTNGPGQQQVAVGLALHLEWSATAELLLDGALERDLEPLLSRAVPEEPDRDRLCALRDRLAHN